MSADKEYTFSVETDAVSMGIDEDGQEIIGEAVFIVAANAHGHMYAYRHKSAAAVRRSEIDALVGAYTKIAKGFEARKPAGWRPSAEHWTFRRFIYGSLAYQFGGGIEEERAWEAKAREAALWRRVGA